MYVVEWHFMVNKVVVDFCRCVFPKTEKTDNMQIDMYLCIEC